MPDTEHPYGAPPGGAELEGDPRGKMVAAGEKIVETAEYYGVPQVAVVRAWGWEENTARRYAPAYKRWLDSGEVVDGDEPEDGRTHRVITDEGAVLYESDSRLINTEADLIEAAQIDLDLWEIERKVENAWQVAMKQKDGRPLTVQLRQVKLFLQRREVKPFEDALRELVETLPPRAFPRVVLHKGGEGEYLFAPTAVDLHAGKRPVDGVYSLAHSMDQIRDIYARMIRFAETMEPMMPVGGALLPLLGDQFHADNLTSTTTRGTWIDMAPRQEEVILALSDVVTDVIEWLADRWPTTVMVIGGNHDEYTSFWFGHFLWGYFRNHPRVTLDYMPARVKHIRWGKTLIAATHGDKIKNVFKLAAQLPFVVPSADWAASQYREMWRGHFHGQREENVAMSEHHGVVVRQFRSISPTDQWHQDRGYVGNHRAAEGLFYHRERGFSGAFPVFVEDMDTAAAPVRLAA